MAVPSIYDLVSSMMNGQMRSISQKATLTSAALVALTSTKVVAANTNRVGLILFNRSSTSAFISMTSPAAMNTNITFVIPAQTHLILTQPIYTGDIFGIRDSGTGLVFVTELT